MKLTRLFAICSLVLLSGFFISSCKQQEQGPAQRAGANVDDAVGDAKEATAEAVEDAKEATEDAVEATGEALEDAGEAVKDSTN